MTASLDHITRRALSTRATVQATYDLTRACLANGIAGDFVECGVFDGAQVAAMAKAVMESGQRRTIHLFDSFDGIPQAGPRDLEFLFAGHKAGLSRSTVPQVEAHMREWGVDESLLHYHMGWFADSVPAAEIGHIALLRLDGDLYESTKVCLEHLYPKLSPGGWLIIDDFALSGCRDAVLEYFGGSSGPAYFQKAA